MSKKMSDEYKVRSLSQRIGALGESLIPTWAIDSNLSASKVGPEDYGLDFFISVLEKNGDNEIFKGKSVVAQCKSSTDLPDHVIIERGDAHVYINSSSVVLLLAVNTTTREIRHKVVDEELITELVTFLESNQKTLNVNVANRFDDNSKIAANIYIATNPYKIAALREAYNQAVIRIKHPNTISGIKIKSGIAQLQLHSHLASELFTVDAIFSEKYRAENPGKVLSASFNSILPKISEGCSSILLSTDGIEFEDLLLKQNGIQLTTQVSKFIDTDILCYRMNSGLTFEMGKCEKDGDDHVHPINFSLRASDKKIQDCLDDFELLSKAQNGGELSISIWSFVDDIKKWDYFHLFTDLIWKAKALSEFNDEIIDLYLSDLKDIRVARCLNLLYGVIFYDPIEAVAPGFVLNGDEPIESMRRIEKKMKIPFIFNLNEKKIAVIMTAVIDLIADSANYICGIVIKKREAINLIFDDGLDIENGCSEIWIHEDWPRINLSQISDGQLTYQHKEMKYVMESA